MNTEEYNRSVDLYSDKAYRFIANNIQNKDKAKDIIQDTYERLWINVGSVCFSKVKSYIFTTAYHLMIDMIRKEKRITGIENTKPENYSHDEQYSDIQQVLHEAVKLLPEDQRAVVLLRDYEGYSYREIEEITGLKEAQVKVYIYRARSFLKNYIGKIEILV